MCQFKFKRYWDAMLFGLLMSVSTLGNAATKEQAVKAGVIYNITKFTVWPASASANEQFNLCIVGDETLGGSLKALRGKLVHNKPLSLLKSPKKDDLYRCHAALVSADGVEDVSQQLKQFKGLPVLTISDSPDFIDQGGMLGLVRDGKHVGFEVNLMTVNAVQLNMSAQLLKLAKKVKGLK